MLAKLRHLGRHHERTVARPGIARKILLVIVLCEVKNARRGDFGYHGVAPQPGAAEIGDHLFGGGFLFRRMMEYRRAVLCAGVVALTVQGGRIVNHEKHFEDFFERHHRGIKRNPHYFRVPGASATYLLVGGIGIFAAHIARLDRNDAFEFVENRLQAPETAAA